MLIIGLVLMGWQAYGRMRQDRFPSISFPFVSVTVTLTGASPSDMEDLVTKPLEDAVSGVAGVQTISSSSREGASQISVQLVEGTDTNIATQDIERRLAAIRSRLPTD